MPASQPSILASGRAAAPFLDSSVGKKVVMAITGTILFGFVTAHMLGNLQAYMGAATMNHYAEFLKGMLHGGGIWIFRAVLLTAAGLHAWAALSLTLTNQAARPIGYRAQTFQASTLASRTMRWTGVTLGIFIIYHLLHLTTGHAHPNFVPGDAYRNFVTGFQVPMASVFYIVAQLCLGFHLWHGIWSLTQTFGLSHPRYDQLRRCFAYGVAVTVAGINISYPIAVLAGIIH
jgi:succinate dehydrogenase / fumarate reductase cytochrome b subunit